MKAGNPVWTLASTGGMVPGRKGVPGEGRPECFLGSATWALILAALRTCKINA